MHRTLLAAAAASVVWGCVPQDGGPRPPGDAAPLDAAPALDRSMDGAPDAGSKPRYLERLATHAEYEMVQGEGGEVKYFARVTGKPGLPPLDKPCVFQNTDLYELHVNFLRSFPELAHLDFPAYLALVMKAATRQLWAGELKFLPSATHPRTGARGVLVYFIYSEANDVDELTVDQIVEVDGRIKGCVPFARELLVLVGMDEDQARRFDQRKAELAGRGVDLVDSRVVRPGVGAEGYSVGEGYGFLHIVPRGQRPADHGPRDVVVAESSPDDLSLVAGLITALPQNLLSHVNLRLREKKIPNARIPDIYDNQVVRLLDGKLVHVIVHETAVQIEPALLPAAEAFWASRRPRVQLPAADLAETRLRDMAELRGRDAAAFGGKAANLGEVQRALPARNRVTGFGVPFSVYRDFMQGSGLQAQVDTLLGDERVHSDAAFRRARLKTLRDAIEAAPVPAALIARLGETARAVWGEGQTRVPVRLRSSSNVEDGVLVSGAGLHDSSRGCFADDADGDEAGPSACLSAEEQAALMADLQRRRAELAAHPERTWLAEVIDDLDKDLTRERSVARALKKVYAGLWNARAFEERAYWGIDHRTAFMGVAVNPSFVLEKLDAVAVTNLDAGPGGPLYRVITQRDGVGVVRPVDPSAVAESLTFRRGPDGKPVDVRVINQSSLATGPLWTDAQLAELAGHLFALHDHFAAQVYPQLPRLSLDVEIKLTRDDRAVIKQARPYVQTGP